MSPHSIFHMRPQPKWRLSAAVLVLFFLAQSAALLHAETHAFHENSDFCSVFHNVEHQPVLGAMAIAAVPPGAHAENQPSLFAQQARKPALHGFLARGPPRFHV